MKISKMSLMGTIVTVGMIGCAENPGVKPASPQGFNPDAPAASASAAVAPLPSASANAPPIPATPKVLPPSASAKVRWQYDGKSGELAGGEAFTLGDTRMMYAYPPSAADCSNVSVTNGLARPNQSGQCQIVVSNAELGAKVGESRDVSISVTGGPSVSFKVSFVH